MLATALHRALPTVRRLTLQRMTGSRRILTPADAGPYDVFVNHRGIDTKKTVAGLLYDRLAQLGLRPFLDSRSMEPGDKLHECIEAAILECRVGVAIFSPRYCESFSCLRELAMLVECRRKLIPVFCDVKPSELRMEDDGAHSLEELERCRSALQEATYTVGLAFDSRTGNWSDFIARTADIVIKNVKRAN